MSSSGDYYALLGLASDASQKEIGKAFRQKARVLHPDKQPPGASEAAKLQAKKAFQQLVTAYETLNDPDKRSHYDLGRSAAVPPRQEATGPRAKQRSRPSGGDANARAERAAPSGREHSSGPAGRPNKQSHRDSRGASGPAVDEDFLRQRRKEEEEREKKHGLGSHWVKPPPAAAASSHRDRWSGWTHSQAGGSPKKTKQSGEDNDSDTSSVLSFDIKKFDMDLKDLDLKDLQTMDDDLTTDTLGGAEVWRFQEPKAPTTDSASTTTDATTDTTGKSGRRRKGPNCRQQ